MRRIVVTLLAAGALFLPLAAPAACGVGPEEVLVVVNDSIGMSAAIGNYYASVRSIPSANIFHLPAGTTVAETITRATYNAQIRNPLITFLTVTRPWLRAQIKYIVLTKGVPHRIMNTAGEGIWQNCASVDSELTQLFTGNVPDEGHLGWVLNPYLDVPMPFEAFSHADLSYLVFRLDGYQTNIDPATGVPRDIKNLIDAAQSPSATGEFVLDAQTDWDDGDTWMVEAAGNLNEMGLPFLLDTRMTTFVRNRAHILGYCSWGSNDPSNPGVPYYGEIPLGSGQVYPGTFARGAIATTYVSSSGRTFLDGSQNYGQSLIADLIRLGVAAANGHVYEPYLHSVARPHILFRRYAEGFQIGEAYYQSIAFLSWQNVLVCDPLMMSSVHGAIPPKMQSVQPGGASYLGGSQVTIRGDDFTTRYDTVVRVNGRNCTIVSIPNSTEMTVAVPPGEPGWATLEVQTPFGTVVRPYAMVYSPALALFGEHRLGANLTFNVWGEPQQGYVILWGQGAAAIPFPPFGTFRLDPTRNLAPLFAGTLAQVVKEIPFTIPNDPAYAGLTIYLQAAIGDDIRHRDAYLTNLVTLAIQ
ncbi:MAG: TIGR03790 family protein [Planctomycetota bacterium]